MGLLGGSVQNSHLSSSLLKIFSPQWAKVAFLLGLLSFGQWLLNDIVHVPPGGFWLLTLGGGIWWFSKPLKAKFDAPTSVKGWKKRCYEVLEHFRDLEDNETANSRIESRTEVLDQIVNRSGPQKIAFVSSKGAALPDYSLIESAIACSKPLHVSWSSSLPHEDNSWVWPSNLYDQDLLVYVLPLPLRAADMIWLEKIPEEQPSWVMALSKDSLSWPDQLKGLQAQLPHRWTDRILRWNQTDKDLLNLFNPVRRVLDNPNKNIDLTCQRLLSRLHRTWQADLEQLRRSKFKLIQQRTQWIVAGVVFASPVPSTDLLALAVANGLMIQEMADIWSCPWDSDAMQAMAKQLARAAIAQGVVEWSGQALLGFAKLHGTSWIAAGSIQALSAAYLTRVVGRSMADWMAINNGVQELDLEALKQQAPKLVANAAKAERVDWKSFLKQAKLWMSKDTFEPQMQTKLLNAI